MDIQKLSTNGIRMMHMAIRLRLAEEDGMPPTQVKEYGVREHADFKEQADEFETELKRRGEKYVPIAW